MKLWIYTNSVLHKYETLTKLVYYSGPIKIVAAKAKQNIGALMSWGTNVTVATAVSASGNTVPPMIEFPRKNYKDYFVNNDPDLFWGRVWKWLGYRLEFKTFMQHFSKHVKPSNEYKVLLIWTITLLIYILKH